MTLFEFFEKDILDTDKKGVVRIYRAKNMNIVLSVIANSIIHKGVDQNGYTTVYSWKLKQQYTGYKVYVDYLIDQKKLERNFYIKKCDSPTNEGVPFGYRFTELMKNELQIHGIILHFNEQPKIKKKGDDEYSDDQDFIKPEISKRLLRDLRSCKVDYNYHKQQLDKPYDKWNRFIDIGRWLRDNEQLYRLQRKDIWFEQKSYRLYTNFVSLSSVYRKNNILLNNEHIVELDLHNSFPIMLALYCLRVNPELKSNYEYRKYCSNVIDGTFYRELTFGLNNIRNCDKEGISKIIISKQVEEEVDSSTSVLPKTKGHEPFRLFNEKKKSIPKTRKYKDEAVGAISEGERVEEVYEESTRLLSRKEVKESFQIYLNGNNNKSTYVDGVSVFINDFMRLTYGSVDEIIKGLKEDNKDKGVVYDTLVRIETDFIFGVIEDLYNRYDGLKILTCHDAIYVPMSFAERVKSIWDEHLAELIMDLPHEDSSCNEEDDEPSDPMGDEMFEYMLRDKDLVRVDDVKKVLVKQKFDYKDLSFLDKDDEDEDDEDFDEWFYKG